MSGNDTAHRRAARAVTRQALREICLLIIDNITRAPPTPIRNFSQATHHSDPTYGEELSSRIMLRYDDCEFKNIFRLSKPTFTSLCEWVTTHAVLKDGRFISIQQKMMIFLWICGHNQTQRQAGFIWHHAVSTISAVFDEVLKAMLAVHEFFVRPMDVNKVADSILYSSKRYPYFQNCIGSVDGTLIPAHVPSSLARLYRCRKGYTAQNVMAAVNHDGTFSYILAGLEGSMHDGRAISLSEADGLMAPAGKYWLADAGFSQGGGYLCPYLGVRYHLKEWGAMEERPRSKEELFNLRHSSLRIGVEKIFGIWKRRFKIVRATAPEYSLEKQTDIVYGLTGLHNFIAAVHHEPLELENEYRNDETEPSDELDSIVRHWTRDSGAEQGPPTRSWIELPPWQKAANGQLFAGPKNCATKEEFDLLRESIATEMWNDYCREIG